jgi:ribosomal protein L11 methyltransferase
VTWISVRVTPSAADRQRTLDALFALGSGGVQEDGDSLVTHLPPGTDEARVRAQLGAVGNGAELRIDPLPDIDWSREWKASVRAHTLGDITVAPPWLASESDPAKTVVIDPAMAFGTGEHGTTRGVIRLMQQVLRPGDIVADLGAGSAVLSIAAVKLGAARAAAIELDPEAIGNAEENVRRNGVEGRVTVVEGDASLLLPLVAPVQLVLANIISSVLTGMLPVIAEALTDGGHAIISGILQDEREMMLGVLASGGWNVVAEDREDEWWSALISRS